MITFDPSHSSSQLNNILTLFPGVQGTSALGLPFEAHRRLRALQAYRNAQSTPEGA